jgi:hypothetical protein
MTPEKLSLKLYQDWKKWNPELTEQVMSQETCEIEPTFMCFADIYFHLSKIIPKHWTIVDLGCAFASQCYYFGKHKKYIGVDAGSIKRFYIPGSEMYEMTIKKFIAQKHPISSLNLKETFAIMSYVPADDMSYLDVKMTFENLFIYYPSEEPLKLHAKWTGKRKND